MTPDGDGLEVLLRVVQSRMVSVRNAMAAEIALEDEEERRRFRDLRLAMQLEMLEAARWACQIGIETPRAPLPGEWVWAFEERYGFVPGTYAGAVGRPSDARVVMVEQDLELAIRVTRAEMAAGDGPVDRAFMAAVFRICAATVIGALVGAPLGALAAHEDIVLKMAEAAVVVGIGATTVEVIQPISVRFTRGPAAPPEVADYHLATTAARNAHDVLPSALSDDPVVDPLDSPDHAVAALKVPAPSPKPDDPVKASTVPEPSPELDESVRAPVRRPRPDDEVWRRPVAPPVRPPLDEPVRGPFRGPGPF